MFQNNDSGIYINGASAYLIDDCEFISNNNYGFQHDNPSSNTPRIVYRKLVNDARGE